VNETGAQLPDVVAQPCGATGIGSLPGSNADEVTRMVAGELPEFPHLVELPDRGPGADMVGRTMSLLAGLAPDLAVETTPAGWRFADAPGREMRRAASWISEDCDAAEHHYRDAPVMKTQLCGPWTLAAAVEMRNGHKAIRDPGAYRDIAAALADAVSQHVADIQRRLPGVAVVVQIDEPSLPSVLAGGVTTVSGIATYRSVDVAVASGHLEMSIKAATALGASTWIHCCAPSPPVDVILRAGASGISCDLALLSAETVNEVGAAVDEGTTLAMGVVPGAAEVSAGAASPVRHWGESSAQRVLERLQRWGFGVEEVCDRLVLTPTCGLAGASPVWARVAYASLREAGRLIRDDAGIPDSVTSAHPQE